MILYTTDKECQLFWQPTSVSDHVENTGLMVWHRENYIQRIESGRDRCTDPAETGSKDAGALRALIKSSSTVGMCGSAKTPTASWGDT